MYDTVALWLNIQRVQGRVQRVDACSSNQLSHPAKHFQAACACCSLGGYQIIRPAVMLTHADIGGAVLLVARPAGTIDAAYHRLTVCVDTRGVSAVSCRQSSSSSCRSSNDSVGGSGGRSDGGNLLTQRDVTQGYPYQG